MGFQRDSPDKSAIGFDLFCLLIDQKLLHSINSEIIYNASEMKCIAKIICFELLMSCCVNKKLQFKGCGPDNVM